jgi:hypothetical protein
MNYGERRETMPVMTEVSEYDGQPSILVAATQLDSHYSRRRATDVLQEWCDFFLAAPSPIREMEFISRTPKRLFAALRRTDAT